MARHFEKTLTPPFEGDAYRIARMELRTVFTNEFPTKYGMWRDGKGEVLTLKLEGTASEVRVANGLPAGVLPGSIIRLDSLSFSGSREDFYCLEKCSIVPKESHSNEEAA